MDDENKDEPEVLETPVEPETPEEPVEPETPAETPEEKAARLEAANTELTEKNKQLFERAKKAETKAKTPPSDLTVRDGLAIAKANVPDEDVDELVEYAKFKKISVTDALNDPSMKAILATHAEERRTAQAAQTGKQARGGTKTSGEDLLAKAERTGEVPDTTEGMQAIFNAKQARRFSRNKR